MSFTKRLQIMGDDLGMSLSDIRKKLNTSHTTSYRVIQGKVPNRFDVVFAYFEDLYDLHWLEFGGFNRGVKKMPYNEHAVAQS